MPQKLTRGSKENLRFRDSRNTQPGAMICKHVEYNGGSICIYIAGFPIACMRNTAETTEITVAKQIKLKFIGGWNPDNSNVKFSNFGSFSKSLSFTLLLSVRRREAGKS
jgi:hypothetical protein